MAAEERISVNVRVRPLVGLGRPDRTWKVRGNTITLGAHMTRTAQQDFAFDNVFGFGSSNEEVYDATARRLVKSVFEGINSTIFAYGQTGSGKTHTMLGSPAIDPGLIPQAVWDLFRLIDTSENRQFLLRVSYMELYKETIRDLLAPENGNLKIKGTVNGLVLVEGLKERIVKSAEDVMSLLREGQTHRHVGETKMNENSSRSHTVFRLVMESREFLQPSPCATPTQAPAEVGAVRVSTLTLVDLAGSERVDKTGATGERLREGASTNKSLVVLGQVIRMLSEGADISGQHIPFRDSKLTHILMPSLGGNARTAVLLTVSLATAHTEESLGTLYFGNAAKSVVCHAQVNETVSEKALLRRQAEEIESLQGKLQQQEGLANQYQARLKQLQECWLTGTPGGGGGGRSGGGVAPKVRSRTDGGRRETWGGRDLQPQLATFRAQMLGRAGSVSPPPPAGAARSATVETDGAALLQGRVAALEAEKEGMEGRHAQSLAELHAEKGRVELELKGQVEQMVEKSRRLVEKERAVQGSLEGKVGALREERDRLTHELGEVRNDRDKLTEEARAFSAERERAAVQHTELLSRVEGMEREAAGMAEEQVRRVRDLQQRTHALQAERDAAAAAVYRERDELQRKAETALAEAASARGERDAQGREVERLRRELEGCQGEARQLETQQRELEAELGSQLKALRDDDEARQEKSQRRVEELTKALHKERDARRTEVESSAADFNTLDRRCKELAGRAEVLAAERDASRAEAAERDSRVRHVAAENEGLRVSLETTALQLKEDRGALDKLRASGSAREGEDAEQAGACRKELERHLSTVEGQVAGLVKQRDEARVRAAELGSEAAALRSRVAALEEETGGVEGRVAALEAGAARREGSLQGRVQALREETGALEALKAAAEARAAGMAGDVSRLRDEVDGARGEARALEGELTALQAELGGLRASHGALESELAAAVRVRDKSSSSSSAASARGTGGGGARVHELLVENGKLLAQNKALLEGKLELLTSLQIAWQGGAAKGTGGLGGKRVGAMDPSLMMTELIV